MKPIEQSTENELYVELAGILAAFRKRRMLILSSGFSEIDTQRTADLIEKLLNRKLLAEAAAPAPFYMMYAEGGYAPKYKHSSLESAQKEAERIAKQNNCTTYVLKPVEQVQPTITVERGPVVAGAKAKPVQHPF